MNTSQCEWKQDDDGIWHTQCGRSFEFIDDGPTENKFRFCCYCGAELVEREYEEAEDADH